jgi:protease II
MAVYDSFKDLIDLAKKYDNKDLYEKILDLQAKVNNLQQKLINKDNIIQEKNNLIKELKNKLETKENLMYNKDDNCYYYLDKEDNQSGQPYCSRCWEKNNEAIHLVDNSNKRYKTCPECETVYVCK